ncbi:MAG: metallophosphoesterase [Planctomycetota bacterium]|jgi:diadenosine tetraphosphatase ApaH/serine/threonine PP2A family protein phosphatase|nr:metallophosphoesterase [Planctomycetota bacterium]MSR38529.1 metallophosphoesterase [Planctomycetota bacterium]
MRIGILGDIHSNLEALSAVVLEMRKERIDEWVQVGDIVGYGPDPTACIDVVRDLKCTVSMGNHDAAVLGILDTAYFNNFARAAILWTRGKIRPSDFDFLRALPLVVARTDYTVVHGTLNLPDQFGYVLSPLEAKDSIALQKTFLCVIGHSHVPAIYCQGKDPDQPLEIAYPAEIEISLEPFSKVLMNVGSVGQPRDRDPRAAYAVYDTKTMICAIKRVEYDIAAVQRKIRKAGLPELLADRLSLGV